ncbi:hypothetical protein CK516_18705 [Nostoc sp. 'Peltigera malacea cyanobiont' DB3992]|nr:hypothetical protein CK516_18705 [Nostoc sp. 'Peltigera malacea cyanobiont' DB3992]
MFSTIFSIIGLVKSIVAIALTTAISVPGCIKALQTYSRFHLIEPHRKPVVINKFLACSIKIYPKID